MPIVTDSYSARTAEQLDQLGAIGLVAYVGRVPNAITRPEHDALLAAGKEVAVIVEHTFDGWKLGYDHGFQLGQEGRAAARSLGRPDLNAVGLAVDDNISPNQLHTALQHIAGFHAGGGLAWVYGTAFLIDRAFQAGLVMHGMQSCSTGFYDNLRVSAHSALHQHCHPDVDLNDVLLGDWGQLPSPIVVPAPRPTPGPRMAQENNVIALIPATPAPDHTQPYVDIAADGKSIVAFFIAPFAEKDKAKVTTAEGVSALHLEPGEIAIRIAARTSTSILVVLGNHETRTIALDPAIAHTAL